MPRLLSGGFLSLELQLPCTARAGSLNMNLLFPSHPFYAFWLMLAFDASAQGTSPSPLKSPCPCRPPSFSAEFTPSGLKHLLAACRTVTLFSNSRGACIALNTPPVSCRVLICAHTAASRSLLSDSFPLLLSVWGLNSYPAHTFAPQQVRDGGAGYNPMYFEQLTHALALQGSWARGNPAITA